MSDKFCFYHGTHIENLPFILKDGIIKRSSDVKDKYKIRKDWGGAMYIYGGIYFCDIDVLMDDFMTFNCYFVINKHLIKQQTMIFNTTWVGSPIQDKETSNKNLKKIKKKLKKDFDKFYHFSIYLDPDDSDSVLKLKLEIIYTYIKKKINSGSIYISTHEVLIPKHIKINNNITNIIVNELVVSSAVHEKALKISNRFTKKYKIVVYDASFLKDKINHLFNNQCMD